MPIEKIPVSQAPENRESAISTVEPEVLEEIVIEELSIDGVCGVY